jgi:hypothetical protein
VFCSAPDFLAIAHHICQIIVRKRISLHIRAAGKTVYGGRIRVRLQSLYQRFYGARFPGIVGVQKNNESGIGVCSLKTGISVGGYSCMTARLHPNTAIVICQFSAEVNGTIA